MLVQGERKIAFKQFETALRLLAEDKGVPLEAIRDTVAASAGPVRNAIQAGTCRLHDEKSLWTGRVCQAGNACQLLQRFAALALV